MRCVRLLLALLTLLLTIPAHARRPIITDEAKVLSSAEESVLEKRLTAWFAMYGTEFRMLLLRDLRGESLEARAKRTFLEWEIGEGREAGFLLVVLPDGRACLQTRPGAQAPVSEADAQQAVREAFAPAFLKDGLFPALNALIDRVELPFRALFSPGFHRRPRGKPVDTYRTHYWSLTCFLFIAFLGASYVRVRRARPAALDRAAESGTVEESYLLTGLRRILRFPSRCPTWFDVLALTAVALTLRCAWLNLPKHALIFDESYYVRHARVILGLPVEMVEHDWWLSGLDPNFEHPPLAKLFMVLTMHLFGDNAWGWRLSSVVFGTASIPLLYAIVRRLRGGHAVALTAAYLLSCDNLSFVHGRIATLDVSFVFFMLCAIYAYLSGFIELAGVSLALSTLCKITGVFGWATLVGFELVRLVVGKWSGRPHDLPWKRLLWLSVCFAVSFLPFLGALDSVWGIYANPIEHVQWIFQYGRDLTNAGLSGSESEPWQWLLNEVQIPYLKTVSVTNGVETVLILFLGAMNPLIVWATPLTLGYALVRTFRRYDELAMLAVAMFVATYLPYWPMRHLGGRICYIYYFLPVMPAVVIATAVALQALAPRWLRIVYLVAVAAAAAAYFPFRELPAL